MVLITSDDILAAQREYDAANRVIQACKAGKLDGIEQAFGLAYQRLVRVGGAQQIKRKYRGR